MKTLFEPVPMNHLTLNNRLLRSATWEGISNPDGSISETGYEIYDELSEGGVGGIITGFTSVMDEDHCFDAMMRLSRDDLIDQYRKLTDLIHARHIPVLPQLALGAYYENGREVDINAMSIEQIESVRQAFIDAAVRAEKAGFDGVQIHMAHFFFLSRFVSPAVNHRKDLYGGSLDNRMRLVLDIMDGIRQKAPNLHLSIKMNSSDFFEGGIDHAQALEIGKLLDQHGIDSIEVSGNGTSMPGIRAGVNEGYFAPFAKELAEQVKVPVMVVGGLRSRYEMESILNSSNIQVLSLSRPLLREPDLPNKFREGIEDTAKCISCNLCYRSKFHQCVFRKSDLAKEARAEGAQK